MKRLPSVLAVPVLVLPLLASPATAQLTFTEVAREAGVMTQHTCASPADAMCDMTGGAGVGDFNGDGRLDLFVLGGARAPDRLYLNNGDGTFSDRAEGYGVDRMHIGSGVAVGDYDNDGWVDLYVTSHGPGWGPSTGEHILYRNNHGVSFTDMAVAAGVNEAGDQVPDGFGATFGDYDLDGDLDLFVASWLVVPVMTRGNRLFRNEGDGTFTDVTGDVIRLPAGTWGFTPTFADMNGDRYPELLLAADFSSSRYFVNEGGFRFRDTTEQSGVGLDTNGMGSAVADFNNDGRLDWYVTSILDPTPNSVIVGDGNKLYINRGGHDFMELAERSGVKEGYWGWGTVAVDFDHDGWLDLAETNGFPALNFVDHPACLWLNNGDLTFTQSAGATNFVHTDDGRGMLNFDYDDDGDQDLVVLSNRGRLRLFRNDLAGQSWLRVFLDTDARPDLAPGGLGSRVKVSVGPNEYHRYLDGGSHYLTTSENSAHFGLAGATVIDELEITWADGTTTVMTQVPANQTLVIVAP